MSPQQRGIPRLESVHPPTHQACILPTYTRTYTLPIYMHSNYISFVCPYQRGAPRLESIHPPKHQHTSIPPVHLYRIWLFSWTSILCVSLSTRHPTPQEPDHRRTAPAASGLWCSKHRCRGWVAFGRQGSWPPWAFARDPCSVLQCVAVCCSVLQCVAVCCSVLQCVAVCCSVLQCVEILGVVGMRAACVLQYVFGALYCFAVYCSVLQCVAMCRTWAFARDP